MPEVHAILSASSSYGVAQLSDLPAEKYEAFLADVSQI